MYTLIILSLIAAQPEVKGKPDPRPKTSQQLIIVDADQVDAANAAAVKVFGPRAAGSFSVKYQDEAKKTYYVASWRMTSEQAAALKKEIDSAIKKEIDSAIKGDKAKVLKIDKAKKETPQSKLADLKIKADSADEKPKDDKPEDPKDPNKEKIQ